MMDVIPIGTKEMNSAIEDVGKEGSTGLVTSWMGLKVCRE